MYACSGETGNGFFEGVCAPSNATGNFSDPTPTDSRIASPEAFHSDACVAIAQLRSLLALRDRFRTQPQGDVGGLHRLRHHPYEVIIERLQVRLVAQPGREGFERLSRVVLAPVEVTVDKRLDATPQGAEQRRYRECRDDHGKLRLLLLASDGAEEGLGRRYAPEVDQRQRA